MKPAGLSGAPDRAGAATTGSGQEEVEEGYRFGRFRLLPQARQLLAGDRPMPLGRRAFELLVALVEAQGAVLSKDALPTRIWPGTVVEENKLQARSRHCARRSARTRRQW
jgi:DNA-binding winged helix-turn-helix (wHTH) protein